MKRNRVTSHRDPTSRYVGEDALGSAFKKIPIQDQEILAAYLYGVSWRVLDRATLGNGESRWSLDVIVSASLQKIRRSEAFEALLEELRSEHGPKYAKPLHEVARRMGLTRLPQCNQCSETIRELAATGRPRIYCSNACKQAAYRARKLSCDNQKRPSQHKEAGASFLVRDPWAAPEEISHDPKMHPWDPEDKWYSDNIRVRWDDYWHPWGRAEGLGRCSPLVAVKVMCVRMIEQIESRNWVPTSPDIEYARNLVDSTSNFDMLSVEALNSVHSSDEARSAIIGKLYRPLWRISAWPSDFEASQVCEVTQLLKCFFRSMLSR